MKRWLALLAIALLLCGCSNAAPSDEDADSGKDPLPQNPGLLVHSLYDAQNPIERITDGAVRAYLPDNGDFLDLKPMGKNFLMFGTKQLLLLYGEGLTEVTSAKMTDLPGADSGMLQIQEEGIAYCDVAGNKIVFLNKYFREVGTFGLPQGILGDVYLTPDWKLVYYCTENGVNVLDLDTGISRVLKEQKAAWQGISGGFQNGAVLRCSILQEDKTEITMLLDVQTGTVLAQGDYLKTLRGSGDCYYVQQGKAHIFGILDQQPVEFHYEGEGMLYPLPDGRCAVALTQTESGSRMDYYDIETGKHTASVTLPDIKGIDGVYSVGNRVWFTSGGALYRWVPERTPLEDPKNYTVPHYHYGDPDEDGLAAIETQLQILEDRYGVEILFWNDVEEIAPWNYSFTAEFRPASYNKYLENLENALEKFPKGFLKTAAKWSESGKLNIALVQGIYGGVETEKYASAAGVQFFANGDAYIALTLGADMETWFCHELGHMIDARILSTTNAYSRWSSLNPWDFKYDNDYTKNQDRMDTKYLEGEKRHFVDFYSMSFAVEDRSRIFEYACMPGNEEVFASKYMQKKLKTVCNGIREAFDLEGKTYLWEQYLEK